MYAKVKFRCTAYCSFPSQVMMETRTSPLGYLRLRKHRILFLRANWQGLSVRFMGLGWNQAETDSRTKPTILWLALGVVLFDILQQILVKLESTKKP